MIPHTLFFFLFIFSLSYGDLTPYLKKNIGDKAKNQSVKNVDAIYLINLDHRPEKLEKVTRQLDPYGITPYRLSAIYGWELPPSVLNEVGMKYQRGMAMGKWVHHYTADKGYFPEEELLCEKFYGKRCVATSMTPGGVGCFLSHLSALQNAYEQGYETIWILEDDVLVEANPHLVGDYITKLDALVGTKGWDILYTGFDEKNGWSYRASNDFLTDLKGMYYLWRPDIDYSDQTKYAKRTLVGDDFIKVGSRLQATSMIYRRSAIKKILDFVNNRHLFLPYDLELHVIPDLHFFTLRPTIVSDETQISDTQENWFSPSSNWEKYQSEVLKNLSSLSQKGNLAIAKTLMSFIQEKKPRTCIEIGAYGGASSYPLAMALKYQKKGMLYAVDYWDRAASSKMVYQNFLNLLEKTQMNTHCKAINKSLQDAALTFDDSSIDTLILNQVTSEEELFESLINYLPKLKEQGYIWVLNPMDPAKAKSISYLMKHCSWIKDTPDRNSGVLFKKENKTPTKRENNTV